MIMQFSAIIFAVLTASFTAASPVPAAAPGGLGGLGGLLDVGPVLASVGGVLNGNDIA